MKSVNITIFKIDISTNLYNIWYEYIKVEEQMTNDQKAYLQLLSCGFFGFVIVGSFFYMISMYFIYMNKTDCLVELSINV